MNKRTLLNIVTVLAALAAVPAFGLAIDDGSVLPSPSNQVVNPTLPVAGTSQLELSQQWWQWALSIPAASNPLLDTTGASAHTNNDGPVFFVAGNAGGSSTRSFTAPTGKPIFFPLVNAFDLEVPTDGCNFQCASGFIPGVGGATNLHATLDGQDLLAFPSFRQTSTAFFTVNLPASLRDAFGFPSQYVGALDSISDGYWVALSGLSAGPHTLVFGGTIPELAPGASPFTVEVTAHIAAVPEPETYALLLAGFGIVGWAASRRSTRALPLIGGDGIRCQPTTPR